VTDTHSIDNLAPRGRSRVTNQRMRGKVNAGALFVEIDGRTAWGRRYRDIVAALADDAGGLSSLSELKYALIRRVAALILESEKIEVSLARGEKADVDLLARISSHIRRLGEAIGIDRKVRDITPTLADLVRKHHEASPAGPPKAPAAPTVPLDPEMLAQPPSALDGDGNEDREERRAAE
jgi:hypothetical protein